MSSSKCCSKLKTHRTGGRQYLTNNHLLENKIDSIMFNRLLSQRLLYGLIIIIKYVCISNHTNIKTCITLLINKCCLHLCMYIRTVNLKFWFFLRRHKPSYEHIIRLIISLECGISTWKWSKIRINQVLFL